MPADLAIEVAGLRLKNPVIAGSGEATMTREGILAAVEAGAGAVVAKSFNESESARAQLQAAEYVLLDEAWRPLPWGPAPRGATLFCRSGLVGASPQEWIDTVAACDRQAAGRDSYVAASLIVADLAEGVHLAREVEAAGIRWLELNVGAPHAAESVPGAIRAESEARAIAALVRSVREAVAIPLTVKVGSEGDLVEAAVAARGAGADAVCLAGRHLGFLPDPATRRPVLGTFAAIGGFWALPLTLRWVAKARAALGPAYPLIGTNGARDGMDVARFMLAGASAVEMTSAVITDGPKALRRALVELEGYLSEHGLRARDIIGNAADSVLSYQEVRGMRA
jgi:dihydroorotate dehydrogenase (NAD+) catalytic subunit